MRVNDHDHAREPPTPLRAISRVELDFSALFDEHYDDIEAYLKRRIDRSAAEDIAQMTFLEAYDRRASYDEQKGAPRGWLFGIATNLMRRYYRTERRQLRAYGRAASREVAPCDAADAICGRLDAHVSSGLLATALAALSQGDRDVLTLHCWPELSHVEIATALGIPTGTVKSRLNRARRQVRAQLDPSFLETSDE